MMLRIEQRDRDIDCDSAVSASQDEAAYLATLLKKGSDHSVNAHVLCSCTEINTFFKGSGLSLGAVHEWGVPFGQGGYDFLFMWLKHIESYYQQQGLCPWFLWVQGPWLTRRSHHLHPGIERFYPLYWQRAGLRLDSLWTMEAPRRFQDLIPIFYAPVFKIVIFDRPGAWKSGEWSFLAERARAQGQTFFILHSFLLQESRGNPWVRSRLNIVRRSTKGAGRKFILRVQAVKGCGPNQLQLPSDFLATMLEKPAFLEVKGTAL